MQKKPLNGSAIKYAPHAYQRKAIKFLIERGGAGLFMDPGLGKTSITLAALKVLMQQKLSTGALVIAPLRPAYEVWPREVAKWADFAHFKVKLLHGPYKVAAANERADIYVMNYEGLEWAVKSGVLRKLIKKVDTIVFDELHKLKHTHTARFKYIKPYLNLFARRWGLTGSPAANGLMDLFGQCYCLDMGRSLGPFITHYRMQYFYQTGYGGYEWAIQHGAADKIYARIKPLVLRMAAEDYLDMPELINNDIMVELPPKARKTYNEMYEQELAVLENLKTVTAANAAGAMNKCRQIINGGLYTDREIDATTGAVSAEREPAIVHNAKTEALADLVDELQGEPLLVAYEFKHDLERILAELGKGTPWIGGGTSPKKVSEYMAAWNAGELPVLLAQPQSIAHGVNLQGSNAHNICWYGVPWNLEYYDQFIARLRRQGNTAKRIINHRILARNTIDEKVVKLLSVKEWNQQALFTALTEK